MSPHLRAGGKCPRLRSSARRVARSADGRVRRRGCERMGGGGRVRDRRDVTRRGSARARATHSSVPHWSDRTDRRRGGAAAARLPGVATRPERPDRRSVPERARSRGRAGRPPGRWPQRATRGAPGLVRRHAALRAEGGQPRRDRGRGPGPGRDEWLGPTGGRGRGGHRGPRRRRGVDHALLGARRATEPRRGTRASTATSISDRRRTWPSPRSSGASTPGSAPAPTASSSTRPAPNSP